MSDRTTLFETALAEALEHGRVFKSSLATLLTAHPDLLVDRYDSRHWGTEDDHADETDRLGAIISAIYAVLLVKSQALTVEQTQRLASASSSLLDGPPQ